MPEAKIDKVKLSQMLRAGKAQREIAQFFGVTESAVSKAKRELNLTVVKSVALENAHRVVDKNLNAIDQLYKINEMANQLLDELETKPNLKLKVMAEIRGQLKLQLEIFQCLYDMKAIEEFQNEVLTAIGEESPDVQKRIIYNLNKKRAIRSAIKFD
jgi:dsDNA-specific endonuclease/ATPase MutS2